MIGAAAPPQFLRLVIGARAFGLVILCAPIVLTGDNTSILALLAVGVIWAAATAADGLRLSPAIVLPAEAALVGSVCALSLETSLAVLGALAVPPFTAALIRGPLGVGLALSAELAALVLVHALISGVMTTEQGAGIFTWIVTGTGLGLIGSFVHSTTPTTVDPLAPYREAQALLRELIDISGGLGAGLDPEKVGTDITGAVRDQVPVAAIAIYLPVNGRATPLVAEAVASPQVEAELESITFQVIHSEAMSRNEHAFAFPLITDHGLVAVVAGGLSGRVNATSTDMDERLRRLATELQPHALRLDTALLFASLRDAATAEERRRLAREIHDGVAQDIASLGYLVDGMVARSTTEQQDELKVLRERITRVVAEVRRSVQTLRSDAGASESLGAAISSIARHLSDSSGIPIRVTADERTARLRPAVEAELLRITQEAMTNAVRHARPTRIEVRCRVAAPRADITVRDDGVGMGTGRPDSHGIEIMRERAVLIDAQMTIEAGEPTGTIVKVRLPGNRVVPPTEGVPGDKVSA